MGGGNRVTYEFAEENKPVRAEGSGSQWKVLIVDDEPEVHEITKAVLKRFLFEGRGLAFYSAYSVQETIEVLKRHPDIDLILLDVVMESDDAGLKAVKRIREELGNRLVRIVLRTGQPGSAPEKEVITHYDIDGYKEKTELTATKLYTTVISSLRTGSHLRTIYEQRAGLERVIEASRAIFATNGVVPFAQEALRQLVAILQTANSVPDCHACTGYFVRVEHDRFKPFATTAAEEGGYRDITLSAESLTHLMRAFKRGESFVDHGACVGFFAPENHHYLLYVGGYGSLSETGMQLVQMFLSNISVALDNIVLQEEMFHSQEEMIEILGDVVESRSFDTARHVHRVAEISYLLAKAAGLDEREALKLRRASPMHDVGKIGIPDSILLKPGQLNADEFEVMKNHTVIGRNILSHSERALFKLAKIIAYEHHERWDGKGYPRGLKGEEISIYGRITALADAFDALVQKRTYKEAWDIERVIAHVKSERGRQFDPMLVDLLLEHIDTVKEIMKRN